MKYTDAINELMEGKKIRLPNWGQFKYLFLINEWTQLETMQDFNHIPFIAIRDNDKIGPAILHNCDIFKTDWEVVL